MWGHGRSHSDATNQPEAQAQLVAGPSPNVRKVQMQLRCAHEDGTVVGERKPTVRGTEWGPTGGRDASNSLFLGPRGRRKGTSICGKTRWFLKPHDNLRGGALLLFPFHR